MGDMKDSGIAWINKIPVDWELKKIKYTLQSRNENNNPIRSRNILSLTAKQGVIPLSEKEGGGNKPKEDYSAYKLAYPGDIVMNSMNILSGSVGLSKYFGCVSPVYYMLRPIDEKNDVRYFNYIFQTTVFQRSLLGLGNGILMKESENGRLNTIRMRIPLDKLGNIFIPVPDSNIQKKIADYLDSICPEIDTLLQDIQLQIEILEEYKKSIITQAVTKGLNPNVEMKDSKIEYIGEIPEHYKLIPLKYVTNSNNKSLPENTSSDYEFDYIDIGSVEYGKGITQMQHMYFKYAPSRARRIVFPDDVILSTVRTYLKATTAIPQNEYQIIVSTGFITLTANKQILPKYLKYAILFDGFISEVESRSVGISYPAINSSEVVRIKVVIPPKSEQEEIAKYLDSKCMEIDGAIFEKKKQLQILEQYKKSLIYEYVTGKKEVPDNE